MADATITTIPTPNPDPGDYDRDGIVEADDYGVWRSSFGLMGAEPVADGNQDGVVDAADYVVWRKNTFRIVPDSLGDYNGDGVIVRTDYELWRSTFGHVGSNLAADGNGDGIVDAADYVTWRSRDRSIVIMPSPQGTSTAANHPNSIAAGLIDEPQLAPRAEFGANTPQSGSVALPASNTAGQDRSGAPSIDQLHFDNLSDVAPSVSHAREDETSARDQWFTVLADAPRHGDRRSARHEVPYRPAPSRFNYSAADDFRARRLQRVVTDEQLIDVQNTVLTSLGGDEFGFEKEFNDGPAESKIIELALATW
jgi:hypothetical protein